MAIKHKHYGIYGIILSKDNRKILLIKKNRGPYTGMYDLPGGSPEPDETATQTLFREIQEETGSQVSSSVYIDDFDIKYPYQKDFKNYELNHRGKLFLTTLTNTPNLFITSSDTSGCIWINLSDINSTNFTPTVVYSAEKINSIGNPP